jgi:FMN-dependent NADH-azoreductase
MKLLEIQSSPRGESSDSIALTKSFIEACKSDNPSIVVDTLNVWRERLPEFDQYGPLLNVEKGIVVYTRGSRFLEGTPIPPSRFDHQATYLDFWLRLVGVRDLRSVTVDNAWNRDRQESEVSLAKGKATLKQLVNWFLASSRAAAIDSLAAGGLNGIHT